MGVIWSSEHANRRCKFFFLYIFLAHMHHVNLQKNSKTNQTDDYISSKPACYESRQAATQFPASPSHPLTACRLLLRLAQIQWKVRTKFQWLASCSVLIVSEIENSGKTIYISRPNFRIFKISRQNRAYVVVDKRPPFSNFKVWYGGTCRFVRKYKKHLNMNVIDEMFLIFPYDARYGMLLRL